MTTNKEKPLQLVIAIAQLGLDRLNVLRTEAQRQQLDFLTLVCSKALDRPYETITSHERNQAKIMLFSYLYDTQTERVKKENA